MSQRELKDLKAPVMEVFSSFQGEGLYAASPQVFLRLAGCPLRCAWCDTPGSWELAEGAQARVRTTTEKRSEPAWASPEDAQRWIDEVDPTGRMTVSVTGGEPLLWAEFLLALRPLLGRRRVHLETAGAHPESLRRVLQACDHVSADLKLPLDMGAPVAVGFDEEEASPVSHEDWRRSRLALLGLLRDRDACGKVVIAGGHPAAAYEELFDDVRERASELWLFLQPATPISGAPGPTREEVERLAAAAKGRGLRARVLGQLHRAWRLP
ncbi:MAG: 7-carboxy-7-deazaguanine synthase QueE [Planctomycetes bacterium]|nr:7-carboxy-7-deazaguanine synthase QueE [Planctomycetota bacterium]